MEKSDLVGSINKFDGDNFRQWRFQVMCALRAKGVKYTLTDACPIDKPDEAKKWDKDDAIAMCTITSAMVYKQVELVENCQTSKEVMDKLNSIFDVKSEVNKLIVHEKFHSYTMNPSDTMAQHTSKVESLAKQIRDSGDTVSDNSVITKILGSLPLKFRGFRQAWLSMSDERQTLANLISRLLDEESNLTTVEEKDVALVASKEKTNMPKEERKPPVCFRCSKRGHIARNCRTQKPNDLSNNKHKYNRSRFNNNKKEGNQGNFSALIVSENKNKHDIWLMDSGCSRHMTSRRDFFECFEELRDLSTVKLGNDEELDIKAQGSIKIKKLIRGKWCDSVIQNVLYVPQLTRNLLSEGMLTEKGMKIIKKDNLVEVYGDGELVACGVKEPNNLYRMLFKTITQDESLLSEETSSLQKWHERLSHVSSDNIVKMVKKNLVSGVKLKDENKIFCEACSLGKQFRLPFKNSDHVKATRPGEVIYSDLSGRMPVSSVSGSRYFALFKDELTGYRVVCFLKHKSDALENFKIFLNQIKRKYNHTVKVLHTDNGSEYCNSDFRNYLNKLGIIHETTAIYTPQQNARAERDMRTIMESARSALYGREMPKYLWAEAVNTAVYILNRTATSQAPNSTPFELWTGKKADLSHAKIFGSVAYMLTPNVFRTKLDAKSKKYIFVGYEGNSKNYRLFDPKTRAIKVSRNVLFDESNLEEKSKNPDLMYFEYCNSSDCDEEDIFQNIIENNGDMNEDDDQVNDQNNQENNVNQENNGDQEINTELDNYNIEQNNENKQNSHEEENDNNVLENNINSREENVSDTRYNLRPRNNLKQPDWFVANFVELDEPHTYEEAVSCENKEKWIEAIQDELNSLEKCGTWKIVPKPVGKKAIGSKWVFKIKRHPNGDIAKFKARLVAKGYSQEYGRDYFETFAPTTRYDSVRIMFAIAAQLSLKLHQFDIKTAFLNGDLYEDVYLLPPLGTNISENYVCKLVKSLYGLKQAARCWNIKFDKFLKELGFVSSFADKCIYSGKVNEKFVILALFVDDGMIFAEERGIINFVIEEMKKEFELTITENPNYYVGMEIKQEGGTIILNQKNYIKQLVKKFGQEESKICSIPIDPNSLIESSNDRRSITVPYRELIGSLMYLAVVSRPDIAYAVNKLARYVSNYSWDHWNAAKRVVRYLKGTDGLGLEYRKEESFNLVGYSDSDYAGDVDTRRSTSGFVFLANRSPIIWCSQLQRTVSLSTTEAEYIAASVAAKDAAWLQQFIMDTRVFEKPLKPISLYMDNQSSIKLVKNPTFHKRTKHIEIRYHFLREKYEQGLLNIFYIETKDQIADLLTKAIPRERFVRLRHKFLVEETCSD